MEGFYIQYIPLFEKFHTNMASCLHPHILPQRTTIYPHPQRHPYELHHLWLKLGRHRILWKVGWWGLLCAEFKCPDHNVWTCSHLITWGWYWACIEPLGIHNSWKMITNLTCGKCKGLQRYFESETRNGPSKISPAVSLAIVARVLKLGSGKRDF